MAKTKRGPQKNVYLIHARPLSAGDEPPGDSIKIDADEQGHVLFREEVKHDKAVEGFADCISLASTMIEKASKISKTYRVESVTLKLGLDAKVGCGFLADAKMEAGIEVEIKRVATE